MNRSSIRSTHKWALGCISRIIDAIASSMLPVYVHIWEDENMEGFLREIQVKV